MKLLFLILFTTVTQAQILPISFDDNVWTPEDVTSATLSAWRIDDNDATTGNPGTNNPAGFTIGAAFGGAYNAHIEVAEILIFAGTVSAAEDILIMDYLNTKYSL